MHLLATSVTKWHLQGQKQDLGISALVRAKKKTPDKCMSIMQIGIQNLPTLLNSKPSETTISKETKLNNQKGDIYVKVQK